MKRRDFFKLGVAGSTSMLATQYAWPSALESETFPSAIPKTDTHMHLFALEELEYPWLANAPEINRTFLPEDFIKATKKAKVGKIVFMESGSSSDSIQELKWVIQQAPKDPRIKGIVASGKIAEAGHIDPKTELLLETGWVKGIRGRTSKEILASPAFPKAMKELADNNLSMDLLTNPSLFEDISKALSKTPYTTYILDHLGNPDIKGNGFEFWAKGIDRLAKIPNLNCKVSGIITKAGKGWTVEMLKPYVHHVIEKFGFDRLVYGGDWPVVLRAGSYLSWAKAFEQLTRGFSKDELRKLYHLNADRIYQLPA